MKAETDESPEHRKISVSSITCAVFLSLVIAYVLASGPVYRLGITSVIDEQIYIDTYGPLHRIAAFTYTGWLLNWYVMLWDPDTGLWRK